MLCLGVWRGGEGRVSKNDFLKRHKFLTFFEIFVLFRMIK